MNLRLTTDVEAFDFELWSKADVMLEDEDRPVPNRACLYVVIKGGLADDREIIYVGESGKLGERFPKHWSDDKGKGPCFEKHNWTHLGVGLREITDTPTRKGYEGDLVKKYQPPCNG